MNRTVRTRRWKPNLVTILICVLALVSTSIGLYPSTAAWLSSYQQSLIVKSSTANLDDLDPSVEEQLKMAHAYNDALIAGVQLESGANVPTGFAQGVGEFSYRDVLNTNAAGVMGRIRIDKINVDLPIYHGTAHETLLKGAGHLEGSHLPVGGEGTRTVITAHRGLVNATMFTHLDKVEAGDRFQIVVLGEVLTYEVRTVEVIQPEDTDTLRAVPGKDLATLITCTPLGINTHRIVVTGERVTPTPMDDIEKATQDPTIPGFPWWAAIAAAVLLAVIAYLIHNGFVDARRANRDAERATRLMADQAA